MDGGEHVLWWRVEENTRSDTEIFWSFKYGSIRTRLENRGAETSLFPSLFPRGLRAARREVSTSVVMISIQMTRKSQCHGLVYYDGDIRPRRSAFIFPLTDKGFWTLRAVKSTDDPFVLRAREGIEMLSIANRRGAYLVDLIPWRKCLIIVYKTELTHQYCYSKIYPLMVPRCWVSSSCKTRRRNFSGYTLHSLQRCETELRERHSLHLSSSIFYSWSTLFAAIGQSPSIVHISADWRMLRWEWYIKWARWRNYCCCWRRLLHWFVHASKRLQ